MSVCRSLRPAGQSGIAGRIRRLRGAHGFMHAAAGHDLFSARASRRRSFTSSEVAARAVSPASRRCRPPGTLRPAIVHRRGHALAATEFGKALLAAQPFQHDADLLLGRKVSTRRASDVLDCFFRRLFLRPEISVSSSLLAATVKGAAPPEGLGVTDERSDRVGFRHQNALRKLSAVPDHLTSAPTAE